MSRKTRHSLVFPDSSYAEHDAANADALKSDGESLEDEKKNQRESEIWDALREEHYEAVEQLPLSLHRQYALLRELDEQATTHNVDLLATLQKYIVLRQCMAELYDPVPNDLGYASHNMPAGQGDAFMFEPSRPLLSSSDSTSALIPGERANPPQTSREILSYIARLSEEIIRASEEKVNLAQAAYDSVDRHIRLIDQAIKEQEMSLSVGMRPGTHAAPIVLPDLVVPRWARPPPAAYSPSLSPQADMDDTSVAAISIGDTLDDPTTVGFVGVPLASALHIKKAGVKKGRGKWLRKREPTAELVEPSGRLRRQSGPGMKILKLTVPPPAAVSSGPPLAPELNPHEPRYCYCNRVSFGEMIACDREDCKREWFHLGCVGLAEAPRGNWYCRDRNNLVSLRDGLRRRRV